MPTAANATSAANATTVAKFTCADDLHQQPMSYLWTYDPLMIFSPVIWPFDWGRPTTIIVDANDKASPHRLPLPCERAMTCRQL